MPCNRTYGTYGMPGGDALPCLLVSLLCVLCGPCGLGSIGELRRDALFHLSPSPAFGLFKQLALFNRFLYPCALLVGRDRHRRARQIAVESDDIHRGLQMPDAARRRHSRQRGQPLLQLLGALVVVMVIRMLDRASSVR